AYLVLGVPLVFVELVCAERREERDFWLICSTLVLVAVLLTQTRLSLLALWLTGAVFAWRVSRRAFRLAVGAAFALMAVLVMAGGRRLSPPGLRTPVSPPGAGTPAPISPGAARPRGGSRTRPGQGGG